MVFCYVPFDLVVTQLKIIVETCTFYGILIILLSRCGRNFKIFLQFMAHLISSFITFFRYFKIDRKVCPNWIPRIFLWVFRLPSLVSHFNKKKYFLSDIFF